MQRCGPRGGRDRIGSLVGDVFIVLWYVRRRSAGKAVEGSEVREVVGSRQGRKEERKGGGER